MSEVHIVDLDDALISWAMEKLGSDYTVEKIDASKVQSKLFRWIVKTYRIHLVKHTLTDGLHPNKKSGGLLKETQQNPHPHFMGTPTFDAESLVKDVLVTGG